MTNTRAHSGQARLPLRCAYYYPYLFMNRCGGRSGYPEQPETPIPSTALRAGSPAPSTAAGEGEKF